MQLYRDDGVVLRTQKLGEADRIVTILGRTTGRVRAVAKGVRRTKSRFGGRLEPFTHVDLMLHPGRSLDVITQAEVIRPYGEPLTGDYPRYTAGVAMLETAERFTPVEKEPALRQLLLLIGGLRALAEREHDSRLVLDAFLLRSLAVAGYAPTLEECARCGAPGRELRLPAFAIAAGDAAPGGRQEAHTMPPAGTAKAGSRVVPFPCAPQRAHSCRTGAYPATARERSRKASRIRRGSCSCSTSARSPPMSSSNCRSAGSFSTGVNRSAVSSMATPAV